MGEVAQQLVKILNLHFKIEEETAFPPLILIVPLSRDEITPDMKDALDIIERLKTKLPTLTRSHLEIIHKLEDFDDAARNEGGLNLPSSHRS